MVVVFVITQQRTDFQRGFVFTYYAFFLFGFALGVWRHVRSRARRADADRAPLGGEPDEPVAAM